MLPQPVKFRVAILTHALAPYRMDFYEQALKALGPEWSGTMIYGQNVQQDHKWQKLFERSWSFASIYAPARQPPEWCFSILRSLKLIKQSFVFPAVSASREVFAQRPNLLWIAEYSSYTIPSLFWAYLRGIPVIVATDMGRGMPRKIAGIGNSITTGFSWIAEMKHRFLGRFVKGQVACSPWARNPCYAGIEHVVLTPHAINTTEYVVDESLREEVPVFLYAGSLTLGKGIDLWFAACQRLRAEVSEPFKIRCVGGGDTEWAQQLAVQYGLTDILEFAGFREGKELIWEYQRASVFVLPTRSDTYGVVAHEAAACGLPLILSCYAGCAEILLEQGKNGFVVNPTNADEMVAAMKSMLNNPLNRQQMGLRSREIAEQWSVQNCGIKVAEMIRLLVME